MFSGIVLPATEKPQVKIPSKLKEALREAKAAVEKRLKDEQKVVSVHVCVGANLEMCCLCVYTLEYFKFWILVLC